MESEFILSSSSVLTGRQNKSGPGLFSLPSTEYSRSFTESLTLLVFPIFHMIVSFCTALPVGMKFSFILSFFFHK